MTRLLVCLAVALTVAASAHASPTDEPDLEIARRHFERGLALYEKSDYAAAIVEFSRAREVRPLPELDYNIGRCYDRLEQRQPAIEAYERFLAAAPGVPTADLARERVTVLRARVLEDAPVSPGRRYLGPIVIGAAAVVLTGVAAGLVGSVASPFHKLETGRCATYCDPSVYSGLQNRATAGYVLFGVAGALAIEDIVWFSLASRKRH